MNPDLCEHLPLIANAPDGIKKLRGLILELAVRGKLVPQDPNDHASDLLKTVEEENAQSHKKPKPQLPIPNDLIPYQAPQSWEWVRLGALFNIVYGKGLSTSQLTDVGYDVFGANGIIGCFNSFLYENPQLLISCRGAYSGKANISPPHCFITSNSLVLENSWKNLELKYFYYALTIADKSKIVTGSAQPQVTTTNLEPFIICVPPLTEQRRIVAKVDELMALCDRLEAEQSQSSIAHTQLVETLLGTLTQSTDAADFEANWQRIAEHFETLFTSEASITALEKTLLQLAVMGKLVAQDPNDVPIDTYLKTINQDSQDLEGKHSVKRRLEPINEKDVDFRVPAGWRWVRLGNIGDTNIGLTYSPSNLSTAGTPVLRSNNIQNGKIDLSNLIRVNCDVKPSALVQEGDLLICARNGSKALVGKTAQINQLNEKMAFGAFMAIFRSPFNSYLNNFINSPLFRHMIDDVNTTTINQITQGNLRSTAVPLPPVAEQQRIVAKVDELMKICGQLKAQLAESKVQESRLADTLVQTALEAA